MRSRRWLLLLGFGLGAAALVLASSGVTTRFLRLGPRDGHELPPTELDRVAVGDRAPDFRLRARSGEIVSLSDFRGRKNVVLVFYRGHW